MKHPADACFRYVVLVLAMLSVPTSALAQQKTAAATRAYNVAVGLHNSEAYDLAAQQWSKFIESHPTDPRIDRAWHYLGICYSKQNKLPEAAKTFQSLLKRFPDFELLDQVLLNLGLVQYNLAHGGKPQLYDAAAATFHRLSEKYPDGKHVADAIFYEGECLYNRGKKADAAKRYAVVVEKHASAVVMPKAMFALAVAQTDLNRHEQATANYNLFLKKFPENPLAAEATMWQGESLYALKRYADAERSYATAAAAAGFTMADYAAVRRADALAAMKKHAAAADQYAAVTKKFPKSQYIGLCNLEAGKKYYAAENFSKAEQFLDKVVASPGKSAVEAAHWLARCLLKQNRPADALAVVEKHLADAAGGQYAAALLLDQADAVYEIPKRRGESLGLYATLASKYPKAPEAPQALYMAAFAAMNLGDYTTAMNHAKTFLKSNADHELATGTKHVLAESSLMLNRHAEAEALYTELLQQAPGDRDAEVWKVHLGTAMYLQKKYRETIDTLTPVAGKIKTPELAAEAWYRIGRSQAALKQYPAAVKSLKASLAAAPKWNLADDAHLVLAYSYQQTKNFKNAKEHARRVIAEFPKSKLLDVAHYRLGECLRLTDQVKAAADEYRLVLKKWPKTHLKRQVFYGLGWAQLGSNDYAGAEKSFTALIDGYPDDKLIPRGRYGRGIARCRLKKFGPAAEDLKAMLQVESSQSEKSRARHVLGLAQKGMKNYADAAATFRAILAEDSNYKETEKVCFELGWSLKSLGKEDEAVKAFVNLTKKFPDGSLAADAWCLVGDRAYEKKDYRRAASAYYAAMNKAGKSTLGEQSAYKLGLSYYRQDDLKNAGQTFNYQCFTWPKGPLSSDGMFMKAECLFKEKKYAAALAAYNMVKQPSNKDIRILVLLHASQAAAQLKQWEKSLDFAIKLTSEFPDAPQVAQALYQQGWAQQNLGRQDEALKLYRQVIARSNLEPAAMAQFMIGEIQFERKQHQEAVKSFFRVSYGYGYPRWQAAATYEAGRCFEVLKKKTQAIKQYKKLIEKFPKSDKAPLAKERIVALQ